MAKPRVMTNVANYKGGESQIHSNADEVGYR